MIANVLGSPHPESAQAKLIGAVHDEHKEKGSTKAPVTPIPVVHVTDVESKPDPIVVDHDPEVQEAPDETVPTPEIGASALAQREALSAEMLAAANRDNS